MNQRTCQLRGEEILRLRRLKSLTVEGLAKSTGVDLKTLKRWIKGEEAFFENVRRLAETLGTSIQNLKQGMEPVYSGVMPAPVDAFNMTFSVGFKRPLSPEGVKILCDYLSEAAAKFEIDLGKNYWGSTAAEAISPVIIPMSPKVLPGWPSWFLESSYAPLADAQGQDVQDDPTQQAKPIRNSDYEVDHILHKNYTIYYRTVRL